jgi:hypothetical protein
MALSSIAQVRLLTQDNAVGFYFVSDDEIEFFLARNNQNVNKTALEVAKVILLQLSMWSANETVDIFSVTGGSKSAEQYRLSLQMFLRSPELNPVFTSVNAYAGGISLTDMQANVDNSDNNYICTPNSSTAQTVQHFGV